MAHELRTGQVDAVLFTSADLQPGGVNRASLEAVIEHGIPCLGTGGTSLGIAVESGANLLQLSGSVSTTSDSRAMAAAAALARHWRASFTPQLPEADLHVLPVLDAALPATLTLSLLNASSLALRPLLSSQASAALSMVGEALSKFGLPAVLAALAARRAAQLGESSVIVGLLAGAVTSASATPLFSAVDAASYPSTAAAALAALLGAMASGLAARRALGYTHMLGLPATASTLISVGGAGIVGGCVGVLLLLPSLWLCAAAHAAMALLRSGPVAARAVMGFALGVLTKWGSMNGYYHSVMFPLIMIEMAEGGSFSLLGAFDMACLCCVCAGVCAGIALTSPSAVEARACRRAVRINLLLGDYVEACYPFMERSRAVGLGAFCSAGLAGAALLVAGDGPVLSSAYLPVPLAVAVARAQSRAMALACGLAFAPAFLATYLSASPSVRREKQQK